MSRKNTVVRHLTNFVRLAAKIPYPVRKMIQKSQYIKNQFSTQFCRNQPLQFRCFAAISAQSRFCAALRFDFTQLPQTDYSCQKNEKSQNKSFTFPN